MSSVGSVNARESRARSCGRSAVISPVGRLPVMSVQLTLALPMMLLLLIVKKKFRFVPRKTRMPLSPVLKSNPRMKTYRVVLFVGSSRTWSIDWAKKPVDVGGVILAHDRTPKFVFGGGQGRRLVGRTFSHSCGPSVAASVGFPFWSRTTS